MGRPTVLVQALVLAVAFATTGVLLAVGGGPAQPARGTVGGDLVNVTHTAWERAWVGPAPATPAPWITGDCLNMSGAYTVGSNVTCIFIINQDYGNNSPPGYSSNIAFATIAVNQPFGVLYSAGGMTSCSRCASQDVVLGMPSVGGTYQLNWTVSLEWVKL